jgi:hypothetical protein
MVNAVKLRSLEDERFYGVLDVALDIRAEVDFHAAQTIIPIMRSVVRYESLGRISSRECWSPCRASREILYEIRKAVTPAIS